jgi:hypothetical protein
VDGIDSPVAAGLCARLVDGIDSLVAAGLCARPVDGVDSLVAARLHSTTTVVGLRPGGLYKVATSTFSLITAY